MRRFGEYDLSRLSDSRIQYMRNPPKFTYIFILIVIVALVVCAAWSMYAVKAEEVQSMGIVSTVDKHPISAEVSGMVSEVVLEEGGISYAGDVLFRLDATEVDLQIRKASSDLESVNARMSNIDAMVSETRKSDPRQPFRESGDQMEFHALFEKYLSDLGPYRFATGIDAAERDRLIDALNMQTRASLISERSSCAASASGLEAQLEALQLARGRYDVRALGGGTVHYDADILRGMYVQAGTLVGSVSGGDGDRVVEMYVLSGDRSKIDIGQECRFTVDGLAQTEYGSLRGTVRDISSDAIVQQGAIIFKVTIGFDATHISDSKGGEVEIRNGMTVRAWVTYEKVTYFKYFMEQIGLGDYF